jgi:hypothetical protein
MSGFGTRIAHSCRQNSTRRATPKTEAKRSWHSHTSSVRTSWDSLCKKRGADIADDHKAESVRTLARAQWVVGARAAALQTLRGAMVQYSTTNRVEQLQLSLEDYEQPLARGR